MNEEGFERLVREHKDRVYSYAAWMLGNLEEARDVTQEALVRLWQHRQQVQPPAARSWLLTTTNRLCIDRLRRSRTRREVDVEDSVEPTVDRTPGPERLAGSAETGRAIEAALAALDPRDRAVVLMREVQGMAYDEIALALDVPLGTLKARLHRARDRLRRQLAGAGVTP